MLYNQKEVIKMEIATLEDGMYIPLYDSYSRVT
jgi:hypothetical protein